MNNPVPALVFGFLLVVTGGTMLYFQTRKQRVLDGEVSDQERLFLKRRSRRRIQVAGRRKETAMAKAASLPSRAGR